MLQLRHGRVPTQARAQERVLRILDAAAQVFAEKGYAGATTNHIAEAADVHVPSVYQYFANKDALLAELWDRHVGEVLDLLRLAIKQNLELPVQQGIRLYVEALLSLHSARPALLAVLYAKSGTLEGVRDLRGEAIEILGPYLRHHQRELREVDLNCAAFVLVAAIEGVVRQAVIPPAPSSEQLLDEMTKLAAFYLGVSV